MTAVVTRHICCSQTYMQVEHSYAQNIDRYLVNDTEGSGAKGGKSESLVHNRDREVVEKRSQRLLSGAYDGQQLHSHQLGGEARELAWHAQSLGGYGIGGE